MALDIPTTAELTATMVSQIESAISQTIPLLPKSFTRVLAKARAGIDVQLYRYAGFIWLQEYVQHATMEECTINGKRVRPLVEWGNLIGLGDPDYGTQAELSCTITVTTQSGTVAGGSNLLRSETGVIYQTLAPVTLDAPTKPVTVRATSDQDGNHGIGAIGNLEAGDTISFANPLPNVVRDVVVDSVSTTGADPETVEAYRARVLSHFQAKPQGGAYADYRQWAEEVSTIVHAYPYTSDDPGQVDVYCESNVDSDGIPTQGELDDVTDSINLDISGLASRRPVNDAVNVYAITRTAFDVEVFGLAGVPESAVETTLDEALDEHFRTREPFILGLSVLPRKDRVTLASVSSIVESIVSAAGGTIESVELEEGGTPITARTLDDGEKAKLSDTGVEFAY